MRFRCFGVMCEFRLLHEWPREHGVEFLKNREVARDSLTYRLFYSVIAHGMNSGLTEFIKEAISAGCFP